jgi:hypothetical protein
MIWMGEKQSGWKLMAWCFAAVVFLAQLQCNIHFHDQSDTQILHECTICTVAAHLDDIDSAEQQFSIEYQSEKLLASEFIVHPPRLALMRVKTRAPPIF